jgi:hypothetical protein
MFRFHWSNRECWHTSDEAPPGAGEYLVSDGISTWVAVRETDQKFGSRTRVKWWRKLSQCCP